MMAATLGRIREFQPDSETATAYLKRVQLFFLANDIAAGKQVSVLLTLVGPKLYELLRSLVSPNLSQDKTYEELAELFKRHYEPEPIVIVERFRFHRRNQVTNENIAEYLAELRRLTTHCKFGTFLEEALRDRLVCGLRSESMQKRLLAEKNLTLKTALDLAHGMESAHRDAKVMKGTESLLGLQKLFISPSSAKHPSASESTACYRCGRTNHSPADCRFRDAQCHHCGKKGHIVPVCRAKKAGAAGHGSADAPKKYKRRSKAAPHQAKWVAAGAGNISDHSQSDPEDLQLLTIGDKSSTPIEVDLTISGKTVTMEVDTGAAVSLVSEETKQRLFPSMALWKSSVRLQTYTAEQMVVRGELQVEVGYGTQSKTLTLIVVAGNGPSLLDRSWLKHLHLDWQRIASVTRQPKSPPQLTSLLERYEDLFREELGTVRSPRPNCKFAPTPNPSFVRLDRSRSRSRRQ